MANQCTKFEVSGLSYGIVSMILHLAVLTQYQHMTDKWTERQTRDDG